MKERHYFASANSSEGFKNHFADINSNNFVYIIKGGPGTGKSSLMKSIGEHFAKKGYNVEYFHCSSDMDSLDGVRIVEKKIAIVDGTAPHITEATLPQVTEKIINVGEYIGNNISSHREEMQKILAKKSEHFYDAYGYLMACNMLIKMEQRKTKIDNAKNDEKATKIIKSLKLGPKKLRGESRNLYKTCIDKGGIRRLNDEYKNTIIVEDKDYYNEVDIINKICNRLSKLNVRYIKILSPLIDSIVEGVYIDSIDTMIVKKDDINNTLIKTMIKKAGYHIDRARYEHKKIEKYYIKYMNYDKLNILKQELIQKIEKK